MDFDFTSVYCSFVNASNRLTRLSMESNYKKKKLMMIVIAVTVQL